MNIGIIGLGIVGSANAFGFKKLGHKVFVHDIKLKTSINIILKTSIVFICVPTPSRKNGACDTRIVEKVLKLLNKKKYQGVICIRSSTEPGFTQKMIDHYKNNNICFVPEFLRERCAKKDFIKDHQLLAVGTKYKKVFKITVKAHGPYPVNKEMITPTEAEILKYFINLYASLRITFANIFYEISNQFGSNYNKIKDCYVKTGRGSPKMYLDVNSNLRGYAGICLPKDTKSIIHLIKKKKLHFDLISSIHSDNQKLKKTVFKGMRFSEKNEK